MNPNASRPQSAANDFYHVFGDDDECGNDLGRKGHTSVNAPATGKKKTKTKPVPGSAAAAAKSPTPTDGDDALAHGDDALAHDDPAATALVGGPSAVINCQHILFLPLRALLLILSHLSLTDLGSCAFTCREMLERITSEPAWMDTFFRYFERKYPTYLITLGLTWRSEFIERTNLVRNIARSVISTHGFHTSTTARPISRVIAFGDHTLALGNADLVILLDSVHGTQRQIARFAPPINHGVTWLMDATDGVGWFPQFAVAFCSPTTGLLNLQFHAHSYLGNAPSEPIHHSVDVELAPSRNTVQPVAVAWLTANPIAHLTFPWPLCQTYSSPSSAIVAVAYSDTSIGLACAGGVNGKCVQLSLPRLAPATDSSSGIHRLCASTCAIVALLADKNDPSRQTLVSVPVPTSLAAHLAHHDNTRHLAKKWERKLSHILDPNRGDIMTNRSPPLVPTASDWDTARTFTIPPHFGSIVQVVYSAHTHPLAILRTSNRKSAPLVLVRVDHSTSPALAATIDLTCAKLMTELPAGTAAGPMTAFACTSGLGEHLLRPMPVYKHFPTMSPYSRVTRTSVLTTMVLALGDTKGNVHVFRVQPPKSSPTGAVPCPVDFDVDHFCTLVGDGGKAAIRAVHVNAGVVVAADVEGAVKVWDPLSGKCLRRFRFVSDERKAEQVVHIGSWQDAPERIVFVLESGRIKVLDVHDPQDKIPRFCAPMKLELGPDTGRMCRGG